MVGRGEDALFLHPFRGRSLPGCRGVINKRKRAWGHAASLTGAMDLMTLILGLAAASGAGLLARHYMTPHCPRCKNREWDRKLCAPLLFCRRCATRIDAQGHAYN